MRLALTEIRRGASRDGPTFFLLHGYAQNRLAFTLGALPELLIERGARVFAGELRGHGRSRDRGPVRHLLSTHLELDLPALLGALDPPVHLIGHSMGGILGYALLARSKSLASLTAIGAPMFLGRGRALTMLAATLAGPLIRLSPRALPMDHLLRWTSALPALQRLTGLASHDHAKSEAIREILAHADPASASIFAELAVMALASAPTIAGVPIVEALHGAAIPVAAVVGSEDLFGGRSSVAPFERPGQAGPRLVIEVLGGAHVDLTIGHHLPATVERLWPFLTEGR